MARSQAGVRRNSVGSMSDRPVYEENHHAKNYQNPDRGRTAGHRGNRPGHRSGRSQFRFGDCPRRRRFVSPAAPKVATVADSATVPAAAPAEDDSDTPIVGSELDRASAAAIAYMGGGRVTGTEIGDEESYYEIELTFDDGSQVDVQLDESFVVVGTEADGSDAEGSSGD